MVKEHSHDWVSIANELERPATECRGRYEKCLEHKDTRRQGMYPLLCS
jgi:hypothetical protein